MSTITSLANTNLFSSFNSSTSSSSQASTATALKNLGSALQGGDLSSAQNSLAAVQLTLPVSSDGTAQPPFGTNADANSDYADVVSALQSGNISSAQIAYAKLQSDLKAGSGEGHHHHHGGGTPPPTDVTSDSTTTATAYSDSTAGANINVTV